MAADESKEALFAWDGRKRGRIGGGEGMARKELKKAKACVAENVPGNLTGNGKALCFGGAFFDRR